MLEKMIENLGLPASADPFKAIPSYCERRIEELTYSLSEFDSLSEMLNVVATAVGTTFKCIYSDEQLMQIKNEYLNRNEKRFAILEKDVDDDVFGVTYRLQDPNMSWGRQFVSVINCRDDKAARAYFTKWHEIAHLLTMSVNTESAFRRTHIKPSALDPEVDSEEKLMDIIAGRLGFLPGLTHRHIKREISFKEIERLRLRLCPEASRQAAIINFVKYWPTPCIHLRAKIALTRTQLEHLHNQSLEFAELPDPALRAVQVAPNEQARAHGFLLFDGFKVPESSVVFRTFMRGNDYGEAVEDMSWWRRPSGRIKVKAMAKAAADSVQALIIPLDY